MFNENIQLSQFEQTVDAH